jgi:hypothetical protein
MRQQVLAWRVTAIQTPPLVFFGSLAQLAPLLPKMWELRLVAPGSKRQSLDATLRVLGIYDNAHAARNVGRGDHSPKSVNE